MPRGSAKGAAAPACLRCLRAARVSNVTTAYNGTDRSAAVLHQVVRHSHQPVRWGARTGAALRPSPRAPVAPTDLSPSEQTIRIIHPPVEPDTTSASDPPPLGDLG